MVFKAFLFTVVSNILQVQYIFKSSVVEYENNDLVVDDNNDARVSLTWALGHLGTRSSYPNKELRDYDPITLEYDINQIQLVIRHGTRYPVLSGIHAINEALLTLNESSNEQLVSWMKDYKNEYLEHRAGQLNGYGQEEEYLIAKRFAKRYPQLIHSLIDGDTISSNDFQAFSSWSNRTSQSGQAFCLGLFEGFGQLGPTNIMSVPILSFPQDHDSLISLDNSCPRWQLEAKARIWELMQPVLETFIAPISRRLSKELNIENVSITDVKNLYDACSTEISMRRRVDTFCKVFNRQDILQLEKIYSGRLRKQDFKLDIKFGHSETTLPLRTFLGLYKDEPILSASSTKEEIENRKFRMSKFGYFANNVAFQLLSRKVDKQLFVRIMDNEEPICVPQCKEVLCTLSEFKAYMTSRIQQCNYEDFCKLQS
ncbi:unnamed protein product [Mucor hiemalis]